MKTGLTPEDVESWGKPPTRRQEIRQLLGLVAVAAATIAVVSVIVLGLYLVMPKAPTDQCLELVGKFVVCPPGF